jgi:hypothetical protein
MNIEHRGRTVCGVYGLGLLQEWDREFQTRYMSVLVCVLSFCVVIVRHEKSTGSGVGMNGYAIVFLKKCVHPNIQCTALIKTTGVCVWNKNRRNAHAQ